MFVLVGDRAYLFAKGIDLAGSQGGGQEQSLVMPEGPEPRTQWRAQRGRRGHTDGRKELEADKEGE